MNTPPAQAAFFYGVQHCTVRATFTKQKHMRNKGDT